MRHLKTMCSTSLELNLLNSILKGQTGTTYCQWGSGSRPKACSLDANVTGVDKRNSACFRVPFERPGLHRIGFADWTRLLTYKLGPSLNSNHCARHGHAERWASSTFKAQPWVNEQVAARWQEALPSPLATSTEPGSVVSATYAQTL